jgi:hypothetical protein
VLLAVLILLLTCLLRISDIVESASSPLVVRMPTTGVPSIGSVERFGASAAAGTAWYFFCDV